MYMITMPRDVLIVFCSMKATGSCGFYITVIVDILAIPDS